MGDKNMGAMEPNRTLPGSQSDSNPRETVLIFLGYVVLIFGALVMVTPLLYMVSTSLKSMGEVFAVPLQWFPSELRWDNFTEPLATRPFARYFFNSLFVATMVTLSNVVTCTMAGYGFSKFHFWGRNVLFMVVLATMMIPLEVIMVPLFLLVRALGWVNTFQGLIIPAGTSAFGIFLMRQFIVTLPNDLMDAARIDGASEFGIYWRIILPLTKPALAALIIFIFMWNWDSFLWPLLIATQDEMRTLPLGIAMFENAYSTNYNQLMAVSLMAMTPVLIVFFALQNYFIRGMVLSGIKG